MNDIPAVDSTDGLTRRQLERAAELACLPDPRAQHWARVHERIAEAAVEAKMEGLRG